jgi:hypothetical protein
MTLKPHIQSLIETGQILALPSARARELADDINGLPMKTTRLDWDQMPYGLKATVPSGEPDEEFEKFCKSVAAAAPALILAYGQDMAIVGETHWVLKNFEELIWGAPGLRYLLGADRAAVECTPILTVVIEYDGADVLRASVPGYHDDDHAELSPALVREAQGTFARLCEALSLRYRATWCEPRGRPAGSGEPTIPQDILDKYDLLAEHVVTHRRWGISDASSRGRYKFRLAQTTRFDDPESDPSTAMLARSPLVHTIESLVVETARRLKPWHGKVPDVFEWTITDEHPALWTLGYWISTVEWTLEEEVPLEFLTPTLAPQVPKFLGSFALAAVRWHVAAAHGCTVSSSYAPARATVGVRFADLEDPFMPIIDIWRCGVVLEASFAEGEPAHIFIHPSTVAAISG